MIIGIDFDNTIIDYNCLFYNAGLSLGVLPVNSSQDKITIRRMLVERGLEDNWVKIQGLVYGKYIRSAKVMEGFSTFASLCFGANWKIFIISHKTQNALIGEKFDLHNSALDWLKENGIYGSGIKNAICGVFFETTRAEKISRINQLGCNIIIDDLVEVLHHPGLPKEMMKILYNPRGKESSNSDYVTATNWNQIYGLIARRYG